MLVWGFANLAYYPPEGLLEDIAADVRKQLPEMPPQAMANALWGLAKLEAKDTVPLFAAAAELLPQKVTQYKWQELSMALWGFCTVRYRPDDLLVAVEARLGDQGSDSAALFPPDCATLVWAFAALVGFFHLAYLFRLISLGFFQ